MTGNKISIHEIELELAAIVSEKKEIEISQIKPESTLSDLGLDSLDIFDLIFSAEYKFGIRFPKEFGTVKTLHDVAVLTHNIINKGN